MLVHIANWLLHASVLKLQESVGMYPDVVEAWNNSQVHHLRELALAYGELYRYIPNSSSADTRNSDGYMSSAQGRLVKD